MLKCGGDGDRCPHYTCSYRIRHLISITTRCGIVALSHTPAAYDYHRYKLHSYSTIADNRLVALREVTLFVDLDRNMLQSSS